MLKATRLRTTLKQYLQKEIKEHAKQAQKQKSSIVSLFSFLFIYFTTNVFLNL